MKKRIKQLVNNPLFSGSAIMILGSNTANALNYLYHFSTGRLLGPSGYGELVALISLLGLVSTIPGSLSLVVTKYVSAAKTDQEVTNLISFLKNKVFLLAVLFFILLSLVSPAIASFLHINKAVYIILIAISFLFSLPALLNRAVLQGLLKFKEMIVTILAENSSKLLISIILIFGGFGVGGTMLAFTLAAGLGWFLTDYYLKNYRKSNPKKPANLRSMTLFVIPVIIQSIALTSLYSSDLILVKHFFSSYEAGLYASLSTLGKIIFFATGPITAVMFPLVSQRQSKGGEFKKILQFSFLMTTALAGFILIIYRLFPNFAIFLLYGSDYLKGADLLVWFGIFISFFTLSSLLINYNLSVGKLGVVILPLVSAIAQIITIWFFHKTLFIVILISIIITALLLMSLIIYSSYGNKSDFSNSTLL